MALRDDLLSQVRSLPDSSLNYHKEAGEDLADIGSENFSRDVGLHLMAEEAGKVVLIQDAIRRLIDGSYGKCIDCGKKISQGRLDALLVLLLDLSTKWLVVNTMDIGEIRPVFDSFFHLVHYRNSGAAWGILQGKSRLLGVFSLLVVAALVWKFDELVEGRWERAAALGLVAGGTLGNLHDRLLHGEVVDFLLFFYRSFHWPAFNVADAAICCGVAGFIVSSLFARRHDAPNSPRP